MPQGVLPEESVGFAVVEPLGEARPLVEHPCQDALARLDAMGLPVVVELPDERGQRSLFWAVSLRGDVAGACQRVQVGVWAAPVDRTWQEPRF